MLRGIPCTLMRGVLERRLFRLAALSTPTRPVDTLAS